MYPYAFSLKMVPVKSGSLCDFLAPNPWSGNPRERWSLNRYMLTSETFATSTRWSSFNREQKQAEDAATRRQKAQQGKLRYNETIGFESPDGRTHMLPRMLLELWRAGEVPDTMLPRLIHDFEPTLKRSDFKMKRTRLIFKVEAYLFLTVSLLALTGFLILHGITLSPHQQLRMRQADWLAQPMTERAFWAEGQGVPAEHCFRLRSAVSVPAGLNTYGPLNLLCSFQADHERRLALMEDYGGPGKPSSIILRGVVLPPGQFNLTPQLMSALAQKVPNLNTTLIFVYNADWGGSGDSYELGELASVLGWFALFCPIPFLIFLVASYFWRARDRRLKEQFRAALGSFSASFSVNPAVHPL